MTGSVFSLFALTPARLALLAAAHRAGAPHVAMLLRDEILRLDSSFSVARYCERQPYRHPETIALMSRAWLASGLPA